MIESHSVDGTVLVTFTLDAAQEAKRASLCGEWNEWSPDADVMQPAARGFTATVALEPGRAYRFRYLLDGDRWDNDWGADAYVANGHGSDDSVVDLTSPRHQAPPVADPARKPTGAERSETQPPEAPDALSTARRVETATRRTSSKKPVARSESPRSS
jgi:hypothetical protein